MCTLLRVCAGVDDLALCRDAFLIGNGLRTREVGLEARYTWEATEGAGDGGRMDTAGDDDLVDGGCEL